MKCRACGSTSIKQVLSLGEQPLANDFRKTSSHDRYPIEVMLCGRCLLGQLSVVVPPERLYSNYHFVTNSGTTIYNHLRQLFCHISQLYGTPRTVVEVGSNNGVTLALWQQFGAKNVLGIEPASNVHAMAIRNNVPTIQGWLSPLTAVQVSQAYPAPDVILMRHVFCHIDDWQQAIRSLAMMAGAQTSIVIEVPYVPDILRQVQFDTIYHEHLSYMTVTAMQALLEGSPFRLSNVLRYPIHGGVVALVLHRKEANRPVDPSVMESTQLEVIEACGEAWRVFGLRVEKAINGLRDFVAVMRDRTFCCYGASAKSTVLLNACQFTEDKIAFITDTTPSKQGCLSPGSKIPIVAPEELTKRQPDFAILSAWNYEREIVKREVDYRERGGKFIVPIPTTRIVE